jgi:hypothetical protein
MTQALPQNRRRSPFAIVGCAIMLLATLAACGGSIVGSSSFSLQQNWWNVRPVVPEQPRRNAISGREWLVGHDAPRGIVQYSLPVFRGDTADVARGDLP